MGWRLWPTKTYVKDCVWLMAYHQELCLTLEGEILGHRRQFVYLKKKKSGRM